MINQSKAKMYLAEERGVSETAWFRSLNTFNFGQYFNEYKTPFGDIYLMNDDALDGNCFMSMLVEEHSYIVLLPVIGAITYSDTNSNEKLVAAGQLFVHSVDKGVTIKISNPFKEGLVNFIQIWIRAHRPGNVLMQDILTYDVNKRLNDMVQVFPVNSSLSVPFGISIGKFSGRGETTYRPDNGNSGLFAFVIEGAFEIEGRLLHARDGMALWEADSAELEALSNDAIMLLLEVPVPVHS